MKKYKNKGQRKKSAQEVKEQGLTRKFEDLRKLQKQANQRLVRLEQLGIKSPAYQAAQAQLEILGKQKKGDRGRRFSETGKATYNEYEMQMKMLKDFLFNMATSTTKGAKEWEEDVWQGALSSDKNLKIQESGITKQEWLDFWSNMPSNKKDRLLGSEVYVRLFRTYTYKNRKLSDNQKMSVEEIAEAIRDEKNMQAAKEKLGLSTKDLKSVDKLKKVEIDTPPEEWTR